MDSEHVATTVGTGPYGYELWARVGSDVIGPYPYAYPYRLVTQ